MEEDKISRNGLLSEAIERCLSEMYDKAQPSVSWEELKQLSREGVYNDKNSFIDQHYLSQDEYIEIIDKYIYAYNLKNPFQGNCDLVIEYLTKGGMKDKYIPQHTDEKGHWHPRYRSYEETPKLADVIGEENAQKCIELITECKNFYNKNSMEVSFRMSVMNYSPSSNIETVREFWKEKDESVIIREKVYNEETGEYE